jgi:hypothetical protein
MSKIFAPSETISRRAGSRSLQIQGSLHQLQKPLRGYTHPLMLPSPIRRHKSVCRPDTTANRKTNTADISGGTFLHPQNGRLSVADSTSKWRYLADTGTDLCVYPGRLIPQYRERVNYELRAANGNTIHTYGWLLLCLNLGVRPTVPSVSPSWSKAPIWGLRPDLYYCWTVAGLLMWGVLSDERTGLSFARFSQQ